MPKHSTESTSSQKIKPAQNPWILYRSDTLKTLSPVDRRRPQQELSKLISARWRQESREVKEIYAIQAEKEKIEHKRLYPDYVFRPRKKNRGNSPPEEKQTIRKRKPIEQKAPISEISEEPKAEKRTRRAPYNLNRAQALKRSAPPSDFAGPNYLPRLAWEELPNVDYAYYLNGMNQTQGSGSQVGRTQMCFRKYYLTMFQKFRYVPSNFSPGIDSRIEPASMLSFNSDIMTPGYITQNYF
jgi:HMG (high mobility group) box